LTFSPIYGNIYTVSLRHHGNIHTTRGRLREMKRSVALVAVVAALVIGFGIGSWTVDSTATPMIDKQDQLIEEQRESLSLLEEKVQLLEEKFHILGIDPYKDHILPQETTQTPEKTRT
jgi:hypothetical protein